MRKNSIRHTKAADSFMRLRLLLFQMALLTVLHAGAQRISFEHSTVNLGNVLWKIPATATFLFTNKDSKHELRVKEVDAGCGCMSVEWSKEAIGRGEQGEIKITYNSMMLGHFDRYIDVYTNAGEKPARIRVKGNVTTGGSVVSMSELFPHRIGDICLNTNNVEFPDVSKGDSTRTYIELLNDGQEVYEPVLMHLPAYITAKAVPAMVARGRRCKIELTLHGDKVPNLGLNQTQIYLARYSGDRVNTGNDITVSGVLLPDVSSMEHGGNAPRFSISTTELKLGKIGKKKKVKGDVVIKNKGLSPLTLSNIQAFNQALSISLPKREIQPEEQIRMTITVDAKYLGLSKAEPKVLIITNDPDHSKEIVIVVFDRD